MLYSQSSVKKLWILKASSNPRSMLLNSWILQILAWRAQTFHFHCKIVSPIFFLPHHFFKPRASYWNGKLFYTLICFYLPQTNSQMWILPLEILVIFITSHPFPGLLSHFGLLCGMLQCLSNWYPIFKSIPT